MSKNIILLYAANFLSGLMFWFATEKLFMLSIGINPVGIAISAVVYLAVTLFFDIPSGVLADKWNRKYTLILSIICLGLSTYLFGISNNLLLYLIATVIYSGYIVLGSGTFQATMYDSLVEIDKAHEYDKHQGRAYGLHFLGVGIGSLAGGYIGQFLGLRETFYLSLIPASLCILALLFLREPRYHKQIIDANIWVHVKTSYRVISSQSLVLHLVILIILCGILYSMQNEFGGLYYIGLGFSAVAMGYANAGKWLFGAIGQLCAPYIGRKRALTLLPLLVFSFAAFSATQGATSFALFLVVAGTYAIIQNQAEATIQDLTPSHLRATTFSIISFTISVTLIPLSLLFGWVAQTFTIFIAYQVIAGLGLLYLCYWVLVSKGRIRSALCHSEL